MRRSPGERILTNTLEEAANETKTTKGGLVVTRREAKVGVCYSASAGPAKEASGMGGMGGMDAGFIGAVHSAAYAH